MSKIVEKPETTKLAKPTKQQNVVMEQLKQSVGVATKQPSKSKQSVEKQPSDAAKRQKSEPKTIALADVARELQINPKIARAKARRNREYFMRIVGKSLEDCSWVSDSKLKPKLIEFLNK